MSVFFFFSMFNRGLNKFREVFADSIISFPSESVNASVNKAGF